MMICLEIGGLLLLGLGLVAAVVVGFRQFFTLRQRGTELRRREAHFRSLIENISDGIAIIDVQGKLVYLSPSFRRIWGWTAEELIDGSVVPLLHPEDLPKVMEKMELAFAHPGQTVAVEVRVRHCDGSWRVLEKVGKVREDGLLVTNNRDITARRQNEDELRRLNAELENRVEARTAELQAALAESRRLAAIIEATSDYVGVADLEGNSLYVNQAGRRMVGLSEKECRQPHNVAGCYPERERQVVGEMVRTALGGGVWSGEVTLLDEKGREIPVSEVTFPLRDGEGHIEHLGTIIRDISPQKRAEEELKRAKEAAEAALAESRRLAAIIEATTDLVATADMAGRVTYLNSAGRRLVGLGEEDALDNFTFADAYPPEEFRRITEEVIPAAIQQGKTAVSMETVILTRDQCPVPASLVGIIHRDDEGRPAYLSAMVRDISERKRIETELQQAKEAAEAASRAKSTFLANMSHELRTPMNAVIGMTGLLLNTPLNPRQRDFVETVRTAGDALLTVINDILDFSKIEAGKLELERQPFDLRACIESALDLLAPQAGQKGLELAYLLDEGVPGGLLGDLTRLRQILVNLLGNAVKFTEKGEVVVEVGMEASGLLHLAVRDTGIGMAPERMHRLFRSFSQIDTSTTREYGGTGLGLAISKRLCEMMGGRMWAESAGPGCGSTFHFTLRAEEAPAPVRQHLKAPRPELGGKRVLIVDDNPTNLKILGLQVQSWGMRCRQESGAAAALSLVRRGDPFDLAVLDMHMPEMDGLELAALIRGQRPELPLVMLTSVGRLNPEAEAGFAAFLTKPVKPSQLYDVLVGIFAGEEAPAACAPAPVEQGALAASLPLRLLLVEDVAVNQKFALQALEEMGYRADVAANGVEALAAVRRLPYDVVLMDVQMPEMDGLEATRRIHQLWREHAPTLPTPQRPRIVAMTANALQGDREICLEAGMDDYISKPIYLEELRATLGRAGGRRPLPAQGEVHPDPVDQEVLEKVRQRRNGDQLIGLYVAEGEQLLGALRGAVEQGDAEEVRRAAHGLKGSSGYVGASQVARLSAVLEQEGRSGTLDDRAAELLEELDLAWGHTRQILGVEPGQVGR